MLYSIKRHRVMEMIPDVIQKMPDFLQRVGTIKLEDVLFSVLLERDEPGCLAGTKAEWGMIEGDAETIWKIAESHGCDFSKERWE